MIWLVYIALFLFGFYALARMQASLRSWTIGIGITLFLLGLFDFLGGWFAVLLWVLYLGVLVPFNVSEIRRNWISKFALNFLKKALPPMSETERTAIEAGTVWWEAELFRGNPDWQKLLSVPSCTLSKEEQAFLDGPAEELCRMLDDWQITHELNDLPPKVWDFIKKKGFFGMIIPKVYGGLEFSAYAHSQVVQRIASRSTTAAVTVMVPNSLGPAELLLSYGTDAQKEHYLPRLAKGEEVPCFALTAPLAGSDAGAIPDSGVVCKRKYKGKTTLGLLVNWEKRYITLGPVATVLGLAFKAYDPDHLLGEDEDLGITCALIPTDTPGVTIGSRHHPLDSAFQNGPNWGKDVFVPMEWIIGGQEQIGNGWRMLMERLAVGRGISLPALSTGAGKLASRATGAYARVRKQFKVPVGKFEGVEEPLARIGGFTYSMDSARRLTLAGLDMGEKPSVVSAIVKYNLTEMMRDVVNDAMDVHGGKGICLGPSNYLGRAYQVVPVGITVEGANILTRSMIIFGQGAMRCHPYLIAEMQAAHEPDAEKALQAFDAALMGHLGHIYANGGRTLLYALFPRLADAPASCGYGANYYRQLARFSAAFALASDMGLAVLGGALKRKEKLSGRYADALSHMYLCSAVLKRFADDGEPEADRPLLDWACQYHLYYVQEALDGVIRHFPLWIVRWKLRTLVFPLGRCLRYPSDHLGHKVASLLLGPSATRDRLTDGVFDSRDPNDVTGCVEHALHCTLKADPIEKKLRDSGVRQPPLTAYSDWLAHLVKEGRLESGEAEVLRDARIAMEKVIRVDDFAPRVPESPKQITAIQRKRAASKKSSV